MPTKQEIEKQLERMLANEMFVSRPKQAEVFECVVRGKLAGREVTQKYIRDRVFPKPPYNPLSTIVRRTMDLVRKLVPKYYATDGKDDAVIIRLRKSSPGNAKMLAGEAYAPVFLDNTRHPVARNVKLGEYYLTREGLGATWPAYVHLQKALAAQPDHVEGLLRMTEFYCAASQTPGITDRERETVLSKALVTLNKATGQAPKLWVSHAVRGLYLTCDRNLRRAKREFNVALSLDRASTERYRGYIFFLMAWGKNKEAAALTAAKLDDNIDAPVAYAQHGMLLSCVPRYAEATKMFRIALKMDQNCVTAHIGMAIVQAKLGQIKKAAQHSKRLRDLLEERVYKQIMHNIAGELEDEKVFEQIVPK